jgi:hypothetical protein
MSHVLPWLLISLSALMLIAVVALQWWSARKRRRPPLPTEWALNPRPVFSSDERRVYRQLREALPHHIVLSKLPLVRFCQPTDPHEARYWYSVLGSVNVTFAICSPNGRVLAAMDLDVDRGGSGARRDVQIKRAVLGACRVRYLRCPVEHLPSIPELQLLVPQAGNQMRGPQAAPTKSPGHDAPDDDADSGRRRQYQTLWRDSNFLHDSFFGARGNPDDQPASEFGPSRAGDTPESGLPSRIPLQPPVRH